MTHFMGRNLSAAKWFSFVNDSASDATVSFRQACVTRYKSD